EVWQTPPFQAVTRQGRLYGRGTADDKGGIMAHIAAAASCLRHKPQVNFKFLFEGEEEIGSPSFASFLEKFYAEIRADAVLVLDMSNFDTGWPALTVSLRGLAALDITVSALQNPVHSGLWGGPVPDPVNALSKILAGLTDNRGRINIPGFYDDVLPLDSREKNNFGKIPMTAALLKKQAGFTAGAEIVGEEKEILSRMWRQPSLTVNAVNAGMGENTGNVIMDKAWARITIRTVPDQDPHKVLRGLKNKIKELCPAGVNVTWQSRGTFSPWLTDISQPGIKTACRAFKNGYGNEPLLVGSGGSIPFVKVFSENFKNVPLILGGIEDPYSKVHAENESLCLSDFIKTVKSEIFFFNYFSKK
ncbi:MAG TPA: M20/M25/M40 family metallo-hydrolase, partial [Spirochaetota bacterium]|nr:M20/M25/M40 family metallo-hydrolase [Spirochaetota bacterium]